MKLQDTYDWCRKQPLFKDWSDHALAAHIVQKAKTGGLLVLTDDTNAEIKVFITYSTNEEAKEVRVDQIISTVKQGMYLLLLHGLRIHNMLPLKDGWKLVYHKKKNNKDHTLNLTPRTIQLLHKYG